MGLLVLLENFSDLFRGSRWLLDWHKVKPKQRLQVPMVWPCGTKSNSVLSFLGDGWWALNVTLAFPGSLLSALRQVLGRREGSKADTLLALLIREGGSTSEHGLCLVVLVSTHTWEPLLLTQVVEVRACVGDRIEWALMSGRKSATWKKWRSFRVLLSTPLREED